MSPAFTLTRASRPTPVVVEVPHAGLEVPDALRGPLVADERTIRRDADLAVDKLWRGAPARGAPLVCARLSRYLCDLNRDPDDVDRASVPRHPSPRREAPRGFVWRVDTDGAPVLSRPLTLEEWEARCARVWSPYHAALRGLVEAARARFGFALLVAAHSMPSVGRSAHADPGVRRADVVPGTRSGESCAAAVTETVCAHFSGRGYTVEIDTPYRGGYTATHYGRPADGVHAIQIELSRALYMDEGTLTLRPDGVARVRADLDALVERLVEVRP